MPADHASDNPDTGGEELPFWEIVRREAADAAREEWERNQEAFRRQLSGYAREAGTGALLGRGAPELLPNLTAVTSRGEELTVVDARNRSWRTFVQGLAIDLGFALLSVLALALSDFDFLSGAAWATLGVLVLKTIIQTAISYIARLKIAPRYDEPAAGPPDGARS
ncbi:hypothetical protein [Rhodococcus pyridinivorans]|uniref:hypothetical protein n=1 Tax=Rhodococcus pyridinivorans TaxID=103816 RepID=UPI003AAAC3A6